MYRPIAILVHIPLGATLERVLAFGDLPRRLEAPEFSAVCDAYGMPRESTAIEDQRSAFVAMESWFVQAPASSSPSPRTRAEPGRRVPWKS